MLPRAVVSGIGLVTPVGSGVDAYWHSLVTGRSGIGPITLFETTGLPVRIGGEVKNLELSGYIPPERSRKMPRAAKHAVVASKMALEDSGIEVTDAKREEIDVFLGVACPGLDSIARTVARRLKRGAEFADANSPAMAVTAAPAANVAIELGLHGEVITFSTGCSSSSNAIGHALRKIRCRAGEIVLAGGSDAGVQIDLIAAYARGGVLSTRNESPKAACRPFEANRDGHVLSDAAVVLVLEEYEHARRRGANVYAEIAGYGVSNDSRSMFMVSKDAGVAARSVTAALKDAGRNGDELGYYCAHGSAARTTDPRETRMLKTALGERAYDVPVSSIKSMTGHPFGASGALQAATCALAIERGAVPPTINYEEPDPECDLDYVPNEAREKDVSLALCYSLGMGGNNAALAVAAC